MDEDMANVVRLRGRVSAAPLARELPSGQPIVSVRLVVTRAPTVMTKGSRQVSDWVVCTAWSSGARRQVARWAAGDEVVVEGALRRRHYVVEGRASSTLEVEVLDGRRSVTGVRRGSGARTAATDDGSD